MDRDEALRIVDSLYAAALGEAPLDPALSMISDAFGGTTTTLEIMNRREGSVVHFESVRLDPESMASYVRDWGTGTSRARFMMTTGHRVGFDQLFITEEEMDRDPFYAEFLAKDGLRYFISANCEVDSDIHALIAVQRPARVFGIDDTHIRNMEALLPHISRALLLL